MRELAHFAGCSHVAIQRLENGTLGGSAALKARIARALRIPVADLWPAESSPEMREPGSGRAQGSRGEQHGKSTPL